MNIEDENFRAILTNVGKAVIANSVLIGNMVNLTKVKLGDSNKEYYEPDEKQEELKHVVWEGNTNNVYIDPDNPNWIVVEAMIPASVGGFWIREGAIYDSDDNLIAVSKLAPTYKPNTSQGTAKDLIIRQIFVVENASNITVKVDPSVMLASKKDIILLETKITDLAAKCNPCYQYAQGTANDIKVTIPELKDGVYVKFIAGFDNEGKDTKINNLPFYKVCSTNPPTIKKDYPYEAYYNLANSCFFLKASASGNAKAGDVLAGKIVSTDEGEIIGIMPERGDYSIPAFELNGDITLPEGHYNSITIKQHLIERSAQTPSISIKKDGKFLYARIPTGAYYDVVEDSQCPEIYTRISDIGDSLSETEKEDFVKELNGTTSYYVEITQTSNDRRELSVNLSKCPFTPKVITFQIVDVDTACGFYDFNIGKKMLPGEYKRTSGITTAWTVRSIGTFDISNVCLVTHTTFDGSYNSPLQANTSYTAKIWCYK